jgi:K+-transporting ATPase KdpF subunit
MPCSATGCEALMLEPILGLIVAMALGAYLLVTLIRPENF